MTANSAVNGGGLHMGYPDGSHSVVRNSTFHANSAVTTGGGISAGLTEPVTMLHATITGNTAPAGANVAVSSFGSIANSIVAQPVGGSNCAPFNGIGPFNLVSNGYSWFDDATCAAVGIDVVTHGGDPQLGPLAANGGPTTTRLPAVGSPVGGLVPLVSCSVATDQRGNVRPSGAACEAGAVEIVELTAPPAITGTPFADLLVGTGGPDTILGLGGNDALFGLAGTDVLEGGNGNDFLNGGPGADILRGGSGTDIVIGTIGDTLDGGAGPDLCFFPGRIFPRDC